MSIVTSKSFDGKHECLFDEESHTYKLDGKPVPGTTTFNKEAYPESPQLVSWKVGQGATYAVEALMEMARNNQIPDADSIKQIIKESKTAFRKFSQKAASIGTVLHDYAYCNEINKPFDDYELVRHPDAHKVLACVAKFKEWKEGNKDELIASEVVVASAEHQFAGKFDRLSRRGGMVVLSDFKTSSGIFIDQWIQLATYRLAIKEWMNVEVDALEILRFGKTDAEFETKIVTDKEEIAKYTEQALRNRETYDFRKRFDN